VPVLVGYCSGSDKNDENGDGDCSPTNNVDDAPACPSKRVRENAQGRRPTIDPVHNSRGTESGQLPMTMAEKVAVTSISSALDSAVAIYYTFARQPCGHKIYPTAARLFLLFLSQICGLGRKDKNILQLSAVS